MKQPAIVIPEGCNEVLLHACCAPCSSAIVEWLLANGVQPTIFYYNPNIYPRDGGLTATIIIRNGCRESVDWNQNRNVGDAVNNASRCE